MLRHQKNFVCVPRKPKVRFVKIILIQKILMVEGVVPSKFDYQLALPRKRISNSSTSQSACLKRQRSELTQECMNIQQAAESETDDVISKLHIIKTETLQTRQNKSTSTEPTFTAEKSVQCNFKKKVQLRSKAVQTHIFKKINKASCIPQFKVKQCCYHIKPSKSGIVNIKRRNGFTDEEKSDSDIILYTEALNQEDAPLAVTSSNILDSNITDIDKLNCLQHNLCLIVKKPMMFIGISEDCHILLNFKLCTYRKVVSKL